MLSIFQKTALRGAGVVPARYGAGYKNHSGVIRFWGMGATPVVVPRETTVADPLGVPPDLESRGTLESEQLLNPKQRLEPVSK